MTTQELLKLAASESPDLVAATAAIMRELESAPDFLADVLADFKTVTEKVETKTKAASVKGWLGEVGNQAAKTIATTAVVGLGLAAATDLYNAAKRGLSNKANWQRMMDANPHLKEHPVEDVRRAFKTVQRFAPDIAADPMVAGSLTYRMAHAPIGDHDKILRDALQLQKDRADAHEKGNIFRSQGKMDFSQKSNPTNIQQQVNFNDEANNRRARRP